MAISRVDYFGKTLIDISDSTVTAETLIEGTVAYTKTGERIIGERSAELMECLTAEEMTDLWNSVVVS